MSSDTISHFIVLFTAQKLKKHKVWQDGTMKYYSVNRKLVLVDEKGYTIDRKFHRGDQPSVGDEIEFDYHIVTIESLESTEVAVNTHQQQQQIETMEHSRSRPSPATVPRITVNANAPPRTSNETTAAARHPPPVRNNRFKQPSVIPRKRTIKDDSEEEEENNEEELPTVSSSSSRVQRVQPPITVEPSIPVKAEPESTTVAQPSISIPSPPRAPLPLPPPPSMLVPPQLPPQPQLPAPPPQPLSPVLPVQAATPIQAAAPVKKRVRMGLSKRTSSVLHQSAKQQQADAYAPRSSAPASSSLSISRNDTDYEMEIDPPTPPAPSTADTPRVSNVPPIATSSFQPATKIASEPTSSANPVKPFKSPLAEGSSNGSNSSGSGASLVLQFPNSKKALSFIKSKKYPKRAKVVPSKFNTSQLYKDTYRKVIYEHLEILLLNYGMYFYSMYERFGKNKTGMELERAIRSKGLGLYINCGFKGNHNNNHRYRLLLDRVSREHYSKYNKDDLWVVSQSSAFESSTTFLARSTYFGPFSDGALELECMSPRDARVATKILGTNKPVCAVRTISAGTECMMLDALEDRLEQLPLLPYVLTGPAGLGSKKKKKSAPVLPTPAQTKLECITLTSQDGIDVEARLVETIRTYRLNRDQESVLRQVARSVIVAPGWSDAESETPVVLVHGVYGSGKSYLAAVVIIFLQDIIDAASARREPEEAIQFKMLVSSMTNVAVDRILQTLLKLGFDHFIRIGSIKKIAKNLLPYTAKARLSSNEEIKELEQMLDDAQNSEQDIDNISVAIQQFRKTETSNRVQSVNVIGTTFMSSTFEVFDGIKFPLILVDESSQLMEPLTMVPLVRFSCHRLVMIGDPMQLPPTLATNPEEGKAGRGLDKTMFDRLIEMGHESIMLRTQYRCHPRISSISNTLFYDRCLINGISSDDRKPLLEGLPTLLFVDVGGMEQRSPRSNSFWNDTEVSIAAYIVQSLLSCEVPSSELGVISLYKEQADRISEKLSSNGTEDNSKNVQISTVDAFQGGEKEVIVLSTVRTSESQFMDNHPRVNVALTRAKRHLIILGNRNVFSMNELWSKILWDCEENCMNETGLRSLLSKAASAAAINNKEY